MHPSSNGSPEEASSTIEEIPPVVEPPQAHLLADITGHPRQSPSMPELVFLNPGRDEETVFKYLVELIRADIVEELLVPVSDRREGYPQAFYRITPDARSIFVRNSEQYLLHPVAN